MTKTTFRTKKWARCVCQDHELLPRFCCLGRRFAAPAGATCFNDSVLQLVVAVNQEEAGRLGGLFERGLQNEVPGLQLVGPDQIVEIEPNCRVRLQARVLVFCAALPDVVSAHTQLHENTFSL